MAAITNTPLTGKHESSDKENIGVIESFVKQYRIEQPEYKLLAEGAKALFEKKFSKKPPGSPIPLIKCLITAREKSADTIEDTINRRERDEKKKQLDKLRKESTTGNSDALRTIETAVNVTEVAIHDKPKNFEEFKFKSIEQIRATMPDLAGIRIILVFPDDDVIVDRFIGENTTQVTPASYWGVKEDGTLRLEQFDDIRNTNNRFVGYRARHYRRRLKKNLSCDEPDELKSWWSENFQPTWESMDVEIQVTSMTMYAWQEVHHDLIYKTHQGELTASEKVTLDMVNGLVHANEIALNQFHQSLDSRLKEIQSPFRDASHLKHWIATYLGQEIHPYFKSSSPKMVLTDSLLSILTLLGLNTPEKLLAVMKDKAAGSTEVKEKSAAPDSIQEVLGLITEWSSVLEWYLLHSPREVDPDASAWILLKICRSKSPFNTTALGDDELSKQFIIMASKVLGFALFQDLNNVFTSLIHGARVRRESDLGQMMLWSGQIEPDSEDPDRGDQGKWDDILRDTRGKLRIFRQSSEVKPLQLSTMIETVIPVAVALLGISTLPDCVWKQLSKHSTLFWPGTMNAKGMARHLHKLTKDIKDLKSLRWISLLVMADDEWKRIPMTNETWSRHNWSFIRSEIPDVMRKDVKCLKSTYLDAWLWANESHNCK